MGSSITPTLTPAYGRDYASKAEVGEALRAGVDFVLHAFGSPWDGKPCSPRDVGPIVKVRYAKGRKVGMFRADTGEVA